MTNEEKMEYYKTLSMEELEKILNDDKLKESDILLASVALTDKQFELGMYYTTEEVMENLFGKNKLVRESL